MIEVQERFEVAAAPPRVWAVLSDPRAVVECMPAASLGAQRDDGAFDASLTVKFGPMKVAFEATVAQELDHGTRRGTVTAQARDRAGTRVKARMEYSVAGNATGSQVELSGQVDISGRMAGMIEGGARAVVKQMTRDFAARLSERCAVVETGQETEG